MCGGDVEIIVFYEMYNKKSPSAYFVSEGQFTHSKLLEHTRENVPLLFTGALGDGYYEPPLLHERRRGLEEFYVGFYF